MKIETILIATPMHDHMRALIEEHRALDHYTLLFRHPDDVSESDVTQADALVAFKRPGNVDMSRFKWVHSLGAGVDKLMNGIDWPEDVLLTRTVTSFGERISEYTLSYLLRQTQKHAEFRRIQVLKEWDFIPPDPLNTRHVVVYGTGEIGSKVAQTCDFFGMTVTGVSRSGETKEPFMHVLTPDKTDSDWEKSMQSAHLIINTMPLTNETQQYFDSEFFEACHDVLFINVGRGESVVDEALLDALDQGQVKEAVLDVFSEEPLPQAHPFWTHPGIEITPHISAITTAEEGLACFLDTVGQLERGKALPNQVNTEQGY
ncbi:D-2-hydroxyacid dehydrogenase [Salisediminibacterium beveridgei]|uniref:D-3-phosphoglycerate dehydrogenase n=1 Tax=Salisediminibacterium beveridgei TaxID=632773 RepID=A0A1D7QXP1_9BACI|nr:D-2-hydroxyacid dehydrogenase [Salisediminibacterium beveridgei]AOM83781.1 D-3-phosphoglycerate dehydrogenase [Salisediminibacterium beveridgei]